MNLRLIILFLLLSKISFSQTSKDSLLKNDIYSLVEEMEFMYGYDQTLREYTLYKTFDKSKIDSIESLPDSLINLEMENRKFNNDSLSKKIFRDYINPKDAEHTERMIEIIRKYGFPTIERLKKYYKTDFIDPEFNPIIILTHSPKNYSEELILLVTEEYNNGNINQCHYGYLLWHFGGRKSLQPMLDNGWIIIEENGQTKLESTCK